MENASLTAIHKALASNYAQQQALHSRSGKLSSQIEEIDKLIEDAELDELDDDDDDIEKCVLGIPNAIRPKSLIPPGQLLDAESPFYEEASQRMRYINNVTDRPLKTKELEALSNAVAQERKRIEALSFDQRRRNDSLSDDSNLNWTIIAEKVSNVISTERPSDECRVKWLGDHHPAINHSSWSSEETQKLNSLCNSATDLGQLDWVKIAEDLGTTRSPLDCMTQGTAPSTDFEWDTELDERLSTAVRLYGIHNWTIVARFVADNATPDQCKWRHDSLINSLSNTPEWTREEDDRLHTVVELYGTSWPDIVAFFPGRKSDTCRARWATLCPEPPSRPLPAQSTRDEVDIPVKVTSETNKVAPKRLVWTSEEDEKILEMTSRMGRKWKAIAMELGTGKLAIMIRRRYGTLTRGQAVEDEERSGSEDGSNAKSKDRTKGKRRKDALDWAPAEADYSGDPSPSNPITPIADGCNNQQPTATILARQDLDRTTQPDVVQQPNIVPAFSTTSTGPSTETPPIARSRPKPKPRGSKPTKASSSAPLETERAEATTSEKAVSRKRGRPKANKQSADNESLEGSSARRKGPPTKKPKSGRYSSNGAQTQEATQGESQSQNAASSSRSGRVVRRPSKFSS